MEDNDNPVLIDSFEIENAKRVKAVKVEFIGKGLVVLYGDNKQGKTSILDLIAYALGGEKYRPSNLHREGSLSYPELRVTLSNGIVAERKGKNSALKVTDPSGKTGGQSLLNKFVHHLALDLPKFLDSKTKGEYLLQIIGVGDELVLLEKEEEKLYNKRFAHGQVGDQKRKYADELTYYPDAPETPVSALELIKEQQAILVKNGENQRKRENVDEIKSNYDVAKKEINIKEAKLAEANRAVDRAKTDLVEAMRIAEKLSYDVKDAQKTAEQLEDESTKEIEAKLNDIDAINVQVRANMDKERANEEAAEYKKDYDELTEAINKVRDDKKALLDGAKMPHPDLTVEKGELLYQGKAWDCMAHSDQLRVATAIVRHLNKKCGFVLMDKLEAMDKKTLQEFTQYLESEGLLAIATRVSDSNDGGSRSILIEDGSSVEDGKKTFVKGEF